MNTDQKSLLNALRQRTINLTEHSSARLKSRCQYVLLCVTGSKALVENFLDCISAVVSRRVGRDDEKFVHEGDDYSLCMSSKVSLRMAVCRLGSKPIVPF